MKNDDILHFYKKILYKRIFPLFFPYVVFFTLYLQAELHLFVSLYTSCLRAAAYLLTKDISPSIPGQTIFEVRGTDLHHFRRAGEMLFVPNGRKSLMITLLHNVGEGRPVP